MNILVTGGAGFIGSHIADAFIGEGHSVTILDDLSTGREANLNPAAKFVNGSICDSPLVEELFSSHQFDLVDHHAAQIDVRKSVLDPVSDATTNIDGSINLLEASHRHKVKHFIFASTGGAIYGEQEYYPADEKHPTRPESPYGVAKRCVELYLHFYKKVYGLSNTIFRYSNVYGPRQDPKGEAGVVAIFCNALMQEQQAFIYGDGTQTRDYVFIGDLVQAHIKALDHIGESDTYNIATGIETDVNTIFTTLSGILTNGKAQPIYSAARLGELIRSVCDPAKAERELGWKATTSLEDGLKATVKYFKDTVK
ncbi:MAG TPA: NAD-dependent epimerase/dehydratase family protein [Candidatus Kapabacteria bacterium]|nr:NAD-dependent epimerase/dehydratase family protein [Candidatus Kapabacteria bacterium]